MDQKTFGTLAYALLGLLAREDGSGYDLSGRLKLTIDNCWQANHSQIYPELARLTEAGFVTHQRVEQEERPDKKVYTLTETGRAALREWVVADTPIAARRDELTVKAFSLWLADKRRGAELFRAHAAAHRAQLQRYEQKIAKLQAIHGPALTQPDQPIFGSYLALQRGISVEREAASWCDWVVETLAAAE